MVVLEKKHKWIIGSFSSIVIISLIVISIILSGVITKQAMMQKDLNDKISNLENQTQQKFNELNLNLNQTQGNVQNLNTQIGSIDEAFTKLKASVSSDFSGIVEDSVKSTVIIKTDSAQGTGFLVTSDGYIVTNAHVLANSNGNLATNIQSITSDQQENSATFVGYNSNMDVAILKISGTYTPFEFADSNSVQIGEKVIAIGNPLGLQFSVSEGIISAVNRAGPNGLNDYFQTDTALNPGNSGGPLINKDGNIIGINNFKTSTGENLGFALESNYLKSTINSIAQDKLNKSLL